MYNLRFPLISLHDYYNAFNEHILDFACSSYLGIMTDFSSDCRFAFVAKQSFPGRSASTPINL